MALANVAVLLARRGLRVLAVDWDLEAPGLEHYFDYFELSIKRGGLLPFLVEQHAQLGANGEASPDHYRHHLWTIDVGGAHRLSLLSSGRAAHADYARVLEHFAWTAFFERGGDFLEQLRGPLARRFRHRADRQSYRDERRGGHLHDPDARRPGHDIHRELPERARCARCHPVGARGPPAPGVRPPGVDRPPIAEP